MQNMESSREFFFGNEDDLIMQNVHKVFALDE